MSYIVFCAEDDENIRELLSCSLVSFGYDVELFEDAIKMFDRLKQKKPDIIILDVMMPIIDGIEALTRLKKDDEYKNLPVVMLTAKTQEIDKICGLDKGADDYIVKPFSILELNSRIKAVLRRSIKRENVLYKDIVLDKNKHRVIISGQEIELTLKEYQLLNILIQNQDKVVSRTELLQKVWGYDYIGETRTLDMHIKTLRQKIGDTPDNPKYIKTIRGIGYTLID